MYDERKTARNRTAIVRLLMLLRSFVIQISFVIRHSAFVILFSVPIAQAAEKVTYESDARPILRQHCFGCHNQDDAAADLALDSFEGISTGGASGQVVAAGDAQASRLWKLITHQEEPKMPPDSDKLPEKQLQVLHAWIKGGLLKDAGSKPLRSNKPSIAKLDAAELGQPPDEPAMPEQLLHEPVLWTSNTGPVDALATSPWAPLAAIAWQRQVSFYDTNTYELLGIIPYVDGVPRVVRFSRDGSLVLIAGGQPAAAGSAALFDVKSGARITTVGEDLDMVLAADISPDLSLIAIGGPKKKVNVYRVADGSLAYQISKHTDWITALGFSPDGRRLATADRSGIALLWEATAGHERADLRGHTGTITALDWRTDSAMLATSSEDGTVRLWNPAGQQIKSVEAHKSGVLSVRFAMNGNWVTTGRDRKVKTWKSDGAAIADLGEHSNLTLLADFTHDTNGSAKVITSDYSGEVRVIDVASKKQVATLQANPPPLSQRFTDAELALQNTQEKIQTGENLLATQLTALEQGRTTHATYEKKLAEAQNALATEQKKYDQLTELLAAYQQQEEPAEEDLNSATKKQQQVAEKSVQAAETTLAKASNETAGLPNLTKLAEQHNQAKANFAAAQQLHQKTLQAKALVEAQQARFAQAPAQFISKAQQHQIKQQKLAKQSGQREAEHQQAAQKLASHSAQLAEVASKLKAFQTKLAELESVETTLQEQENKLAAALGKTQTALSESQQKSKLLEARKQDFVAAEALRKSYSED